MWTAFAGALMGGAAGAAVAVFVTELIKWSLAFVMEQPDWLLLVLPLLGITIAVVWLHVIAKGEAVQRRAPEQPARFRLGPLSSWYIFPRDAARADLTAEVITSAGQEERFPWKLAPIRALAILATVGLGAPMGTEAPAAHLGVATGSALGAHPRLARFVRPASVAGGAAGVAALMGIPLVGTAFILELGRRRSIPLSQQRVIAAVVGGLVGYAINVAFDLDLIRLVVPKVPPANLKQALGAALFIGAIAGAITSLTGAAIYWARGLKLSPSIRLLLGGLALTACALLVSAISTPTAAVGPGGAAIVWAETTEVAALALLAVALLRATMTTVAVVAGGCGGVFVPFLAIGDIAGRVFATAFGVPPDLAGAAGAAAGITGGYRLPVTALMMVIGVGGPYAATLTCFATVGVATLAAIYSTRAVTKLTTLVIAATRRLHLSHHST